MSLGQRANVFLFYDQKEEQNTGMSSSDTNPMTTHTPPANSMSNNFVTQYTRESQNYNIRLVVNPQACSFVNRNVLNTLSEVNDQIIHTLFWLKEDIQALTVNQPNLFQKLVQLDESVSHFKLNNSKLPEITDFSHTASSIFNDMPNNFSNGNSPKSSNHEAVSRLTSTNLGQPFKTSYQLSKTLLSDFLCMIDHQMVQNQIPLLEKYLEVLTKCCKRLPYNNKNQEQEDLIQDNLLTKTNLKLAIKNVVASITSVNISTTSVKKLQTVLINLAKYSISLGQLIENEIIENVLSLGHKLSQHLEQLFKEVLAHNAEMLKNDPKGVQKSRKRNLSFNQDLYIENNAGASATNSTSAALESMQKSNRVKENKKTMKCELQLPSMQNLTSRSSNQAYLLRVLKVLIQVRKKAILPLLEKKNNSEKQKLNSHDQYREVIQVSAPQLLRPQTSLMEPVNIVSDDRHYVQNRETGSMLSVTDYNYRRTHTTNGMANFSIRNLMGNPEEYLDFHNSNADNISASLDLSQITVRESENVSQPKSESGEKEGTTAEDPIKYNGSLTFSWNQTLNSWIISSNGKNTVDYVECDPEEFKKQNQINQDMKKEIDQNKKENSDKKSTSSPSSSSSQKNSKTSSKSPESGQKAKKSATEEELPTIVTLADKLVKLEPLWSILSECLEAFDDSGDSHAYLIVQNAVEAFFMVHSLDERENNQYKILRKMKEAKEKKEKAQKEKEAGSQGNNKDGKDENKTVVPVKQTSSSTQLIDPNLPKETQKFIKFADKHRVALNQILRKENEKLMNGPFAVLCNYTQVLDFDRKRAYWVGF